MSITGSRAAGVITKSVGGKSFTLPASLPLSPFENGLAWILDSISFASRKLFGSTVTQFLRNSMRVTWGILKFPPYVAIFSTTAVLMRSLPIIQAPIFKVAVPSIMRMVDEKFRVHRQTLLQDVKGRVLDVGCGGGAYLQYMTNASQIVAVEPALFLHGVIQKQAENVQVADRLKIVATLDDVMLDPSNHGAFDWIILGNVLCEVPHVQTTVQQIDKLLNRESGTVYFSEHVASPWSKPFRRYYQEILDPIRHRASMGCHCNRDSVDILSNTLSNVDVVQWVYDDIQIVYNVFVIGLAVRKKPSDTGITSTSSV
jgi:SAM-dependent methyltransferase